MAVATPEPKDSPKRMTSSGDTFSSLNSHSRARDESEMIILFSWPARVAAITPVTDQQQGIALIQQKLAPIGPAFNVSCISMKNHNVRLALFGIPVGEFQLIFGLSLDFFINALKLP